MTFKTSLTSITPMLLSIVAVGTSMATFYVKSMVSESVHASHEGPRTELEDLKNRVLIIEQSEMTRAKVYATVVRLDRALTRMEVHVEYLSNVDTRLAAIEQAIMERSYNGN